MQATSADFVDLGNQLPSPPRVLNFPGDGHPNPEGHRYVADAILDWIGREMPELEAPPAPDAQTVLSSRAELGVLHGPGREHDRRRE